MSPRTAAVKRSPVLASGPWKGVYDTPDPFDSAPDRLRDVLNGYIPDPDAGSGVYARNGFALGNAGAAITSGVPFSDQTNQAIYAHTQLDGSILNFLVVDGHVFRVGSPSESAMTLTDVTPAGITIQSGGPTPVFITSCVKNVGGTTQSVLIVNDQNNRPWIGTNLTATPITGAYIDYDGLGSAWTAVGRPVVWQGSVFFVLKTVNGVSRREDISWSEPGQPDVGYQQSTFDNNMTLTQHATGPLYALAATNLALYYFRAESIGVIYGSIGSLSSTNTQDAVSMNVGCTCSSTIQQFGTSIFFCDSLMRPYRLTPGSPPDPIWYQMRTETRSWGANAADEMSQIATTLEYAKSVIEPTLNLYLVLTHRDDTSAATNHPPTELSAFSAVNGRYMGRWTIWDGGSGGVGVTAMGLLYGPYLNTPVLCVSGEKTVGSGTLGYFWFFKVGGWPTIANQWLDNGIHPNVKVVTDRIGETSDTVWYVDRATFVTGNASPCQVAIGTPNAQNVVEGTPTPSASQDGTYRLVVGCDGISGRGPSVTVSPTASDTTLDQWSLHRVELTAVPSAAGPEEP